uniref:Uncharacterized protein n=1 Tax=Sinocyclocheilus grahami TaxID=75366 RepID=A0A672JYZ5_SINGR
MASHGFWFLGAENASGNGSQSPNTPRAWCQAAAQKFPGGIGSKLCALLNVGEAEKTAQAPVKAEDGSTAESCGCNKPCNCSKATLFFSDLYSTGKAQSHLFVEENMFIQLCFIVLERPLCRLFLLLLQTCSLCTCMNALPSELVKYNPRYSHIYIYIYVCLVQTGGSFSGNMDSLASNIVHCR